MPVLLAMMQPPVCRAASVGLVELMNMVKSTLNNANDNWKNNFRKFEHAIMCIIEELETQKITQMVLSRNFKLNSSQYFISILKKKIPKDMRGD